MAITWVAQTSTPLSGGNPFDHVAHVNGSSYRHSSVRYTGGNEYSMNHTYAWSGAAVSLYNISVAAPAPATQTSAMYCIKLQDGRVFVGGGINISGSAAQNRCWLGTYYWASNAYNWVESTALPVGMHCSYNGATLLPDGRILLTATRSGTSPSWVYGNVYFGTVSGDTISWEAGGSCPGAVGATAHSVALLPDGRVMLAIGGATTADPTAYYLGVISGTTITWTLATLTGDHTWTTYSTRIVSLDDGRVLAYNATNAKSVARTIVVSGDTLLFTALGAGPSTGGVTAYGLWQLPDSKLVIATSGGPNNALFVGTIDNLTTLGGALHSKSTIVSTITNLTVTFETALSSESTLTATLSSIPLFAASLSSQSTLTATLSDYTPVLRPVRFRADLYSESTLSASLSTQKRFAAALSSESVLSATMQTGALLASDLASSSTVTANLSTPVIFRVDLESQSSLTADLSTQVRFAANLICRSDVSAFLSIPGKQKIDECYVYISNSDLAVKVRRYG